MTTTHETHGHATAPVFAYEEIPSAEAQEANAAVTQAVEGVVEAAEEVAETEVVDIASLSPAERLEYLQKLADENAALRRKAAELTTALQHAKSPASTRARKDPERDAKILLQPVKDIIAAIEPTTTEKDPRPKRRYVGSVNVPMADGTHERFHVTVVITPAKRG